VTLGIDWDPRGFNLTSEGIATSYSGGGGGHAIVAQHVLFIGHTLVIRIDNSHLEHQEGTPLSVPNNCFYVTESWWNRYVVKSRYGVYGWVPKAARAIATGKVHIMSGRKHRFNSEGNAI